MNDETLRTAFESWEILSASQDEMLAYEARLKYVLDEEAAVREAELREQEALEKGLEKGLKKGLEKGRQEGKESIARRLLEKNMDIDDIVDATGIDKNRILEIQKELKD